MVLKSAFLAPRFFPILEKNPQFWGPAGRSPKPFLNESGAQKTSHLSGKNGKKCEKWPKWCNWSLWLNLLKIRFFRVSAKNPQTTRKRKNKRVFTELSHKEQLHYFAHFFAFFWLFSRILAKPILSGANASAPKTLKRARKKTCILSLRFTKRAFLRYYFEARFNRFFTIFAFFLVAPLGYVFGAFGRYLRKFILLNMTLFYSVFRHFWRSLADFLRFLAAVGVYPRALF